MGVMLVTGIAAVFVARRRRELLEIWWMLLALGSAAVLSDVSAEHCFCGAYCPSWNSCNFRGDGWGVLGFVFAFFLAAAIGRASRPWLGGLTIAITLHDAGPPRWS